MIRAYDKNTIAKPMADNTITFAILLLIPFTRPTIAREKAGKEKRIINRINEGE